MNPLNLAQQLARNFASRADEADRKGKLPPEDIEDLQASGYPALNVPKELGGYGLSMRDSIAAQLELAQGSTSTALVAGMHMHVMAHNSEIREWDEAFFEQLCQEIVHDGALVNSVASEPKLGSPSRGGSFQTYAELRDDGQQWRVNGHKTWTTGSPYLTYMLVKLSVQGGNGIIAIRKDTPGLRIEQTWGDALSLRASDSHDVYFDNVLVPYKNLIQRVEGRGPSNLWFPMVMAATYLGAGLAARTAVIQFVLERVPTALGRPIATLPKIQRQIGEMDMQLQAARSLLLEVAGEWHGDGDRSQMMPRITAAKLMAVETAMSVTEKALQVAGGSSITRDLPLERYFRDARAGSMHPPSGDSAYEAIGKAAIGPINTPELVA